MCVWRGCCCVRVLCVFGTAGSNLVAIILHILAGDACRRQLIPSYGTYRPHHAPARQPPSPGMIYESHAFDGCTNCTKYSHTHTPRHTHRESNIVNILQRAEEDERGKYRPLRFLSLLLPFLFALFIFHSNFPLKRMFVTSM